MRVTVSETSGDPARFAKDWGALVDHVKAEKSDLVLLPEMPFFDWFAARRPFNAEVWRTAVGAHHSWEQRLEELAPAIVLWTRPTERNGVRQNEGCLWESGKGARSVHVKRYVPDVEGAWEASWYRPGKLGFKAATIGKAKVGFAVCSEVWAMDRILQYARDGVHLIVVPRATETATLDKWLAGIRTAAIVSGAYLLSSNRASEPGGAIPFGGQGCVVDPDGKVLAMTDPTRPFATVEVDLRLAEKAKSSYPRDLVLRGV